MLLNFAPSFKYPELRLQSLNVNFLGGVVFFEDLHYITKNVSIRIRGGAVLARLFATSFRKVVSQSDLPCRLEAQLRGLEAVIMNNRSVDVMLIRLHALILPFVQLFLRSAG